jgi:hypothetical protein
MNFIGRFLYLIDCLLTGLATGTFGMSLSALCGSLLKRGIAPWWVRAISWACNLVQPNHCELARLADIANNQHTVLVLECEANP